MVHYWTGGAPSPRRVSNVSADGAYVEAPDIWYPGTVITLIFQPGSVHPPDAHDQPVHDPGLPSCTTRAVVVRSTPDGFGVEFLFENQDERTGFQHFLREAVGIGAASGIPPLGGRAAAR